ncbi:AAA family ATPase [Nocardioides sp.]|uniref:AAA family ATPase n=1 Tax=Nocardioides sp. TaxID=35761 RepID=UPI0035163197
MEPTSPPSPAHQPAPSAPTSPGWAPPADADIETVARAAARIRANVEKVVQGKSEVITSAVVVLLAEGHLLLEDVPGVGKTLLSKALARSIDASVRRIQFTPDLLPSDVTGVSVYDQGTRSFEFRPGGVFANIVIGDEINRASPKTQSALLECMAERQVTVDNVTYPLESPFMVIATQNPVEMEGTYPLPEAQRDRFMARLSVGYPVPTAEIAMISQHGAANPLDELEAVTTTEELRKLCSVVAAVHVAAPLQRYAVELVSATREHPELVLGASPRATLHLVRAAKARAALEHRDYVIPDDLVSLLQPVLAHRLLPSSEAAMNGRDVAAVLDDIAARVPVPSPAR